MSEVRWLEPQECLVLHELLFSHNAHSVGIRDEAALMTALSEPKQRFAAGCTALVELAAVYATSIARARPFTGGNLATAFLAAITFLRGNGLLFTGKEVPAVATMVELAGGVMSEASYAAYLRVNCRLP